jgi:hypothetical protein
MVVKVINNINGPDRLVLTLLVFGAYPGMNKLDLPVFNITQQATIIRKAMVEIAKLQTKKAVNNILYYRNGPDTTLVYDLLLNSEVLV